MANYRIRKPPTYTWNDFCSNPTTEPQILTYMNKLLFPALLGTVLCISSCSFIINNIFYGTNCETCRVVDTWGDVAWCSSECWGEEAKDEMRAECEEYVETWGGCCECFYGED